MTRSDLIAFAVATTCPVCELRSRAVLFRSEHTTERTANAVAEQVRCQLQGAHRRLSPRCAR